MKGPGRVYKIVCAVSDDVYIGSTFQEIRHRFQEHKSKSKTKKSIELYKLFDKYGIENFKIMLIREYNVNDRRCLMIWETFWIDKLNCINKVIPIDLFNGKCIHKKNKQYCKQCCGFSLCSHNKVKATCKNCKGSRICEHNKQKTHCKDCKGSQICQHNKQKTNCKECNDYICEICDKKYAGKASLKRHNLKFHNV